MYLYIIALGYKEYIEHRLDNFTVQYQWKITDGVLKLYLAQISFLDYLRYLSISTVKVIASHINTVRLHEK